MPIVKVGVKHKLLNSRVVALKFSVFVKGTGLVWIDTVQTKPTEAEILNIIEDN